MADGETKLELTIDVRRESYAGFFDHRWAEEFLGLAHGTKMYQAAMDLCADWKGVANTFRMPSLLIDHIGSYHDGFVRGTEPLSLKLIEAVCDYVVRQPGMALSRMKRQQLARVMQEPAAKMRDASGSTPCPFPADALWREYLTHSEFTLSLWASQRLCYGAVYYAYENFLRQCVAIGRGDSDYRASNASVLARDIDDTLGPGLASELVDSAEVTTARLFRNALVHNGGRLTASLKARRPSTAAGSDGLLTVMPEHVVGLFELLKGKARRALGLALA